MQIILKTTGKYLLVLTMFLFFINLIDAQNLENIFSSEKLVEKELWKKERLNYYLNDQDENSMNPQSYYYRAQKKFVNGLYKNAISDFKKSLTDDKNPDFSHSLTGNEPSNAKACFNISLIYQQLEKYDSAIIYCQKAIDYDEYYLDAYIQKAAILYDKGNNNEAIVFLDKANEIFPKSKKINFTQALIYLNQNKVRKAKQYLNEAIEIDPSYEEANILLSSIFLYEHNLDKAMDILTYSIDHSIKPITALYFRASLYIVQRDTLKAYFDLNRALQLDSINNPVMVPLMNLDFHYKNYERADSLGIVWVNSSMYDEINSPDRSNYYFYEFKYLFNYINDSLANKKEKDLFNSVCTCFANNDETTFDSIYCKKLEIDSTSLFLKRLYILANWNFTYSQETNSLFMRDLNFDKEPKIYRFLNNPTQLNSVIDQVIELDSNAINLYWIKGYIQLLQEEYDSTILTANKSLSLDSSYLEPYKILALCNYYNKNYEEAAKYFNILDSHEIVFKYSDSFLAYSEYKSGNYKAALEANTKAFKNNEDLEFPIYNQGLCYEMNNMPDSALRLYQWLSEIQPLQSDYTRGKVRAYLEMNQTDKAIETLIEASKRDYSDETLLVDLADLYREDGKYEEAISTYKKVLRKDKNYTYAYLETAECYMFLKDYSSALENYDNAISCNIEYAQCYIGKTECLRKMGDYKSSNQVALIITQLSDNQVDGYVLLSENYFYLNQYTISISMGLKALQLDPGNKSALYQVAASTLAKGNVEDAKQLYEKIVGSESVEKSEAYTDALKTLQYMCTWNIQETTAKEILENIFHGNLN